MEKIPITKVSVLRLKEKQEEHRTLETLCLFTEVKNISSCTKNIYSFL